MTENASQALLSIAQLTGKQLNNWEGQQYVNRMLDEVRDIYHDWEYKLSIDSFKSSFVDHGADSYGEYDFVKQWEGGSGDWGYIALLKTPRDAAGALVEIGLMDQWSKALPLDEYRCVLRYPVTHNGRQDNSRPCENYGLHNEGGTALLMLSTLSFVELFAMVRELEMNIFLNDYRKKRPYSNEE